MRLLVLGDESRAKFLLGRSLQQAGFVIDVVRDGAALAGRVRKHGYDIILLDDLQGGKTGNELCRELRTQGVVAW